MKRNCYNDLEGRVAIVTGATSGMGREIAIRLAEQGSSIIINGRNQKRGLDVVEEIKDKNGSAVFIRGDVSIPKTNKTLVEAAIETYGRLDFLVMSAGELGIGSITEIDIQTWEKTIATNLNSVFYLLHYGLPELKKSKRGSVVVIGSIAAFKVFPNHPAYCASKGALTQLVRQVALDFGPQVRINQVCPGQVDTPLLRNSVRAFDNPEEIIKQTEEKLPMKRLGLPKDIAEMVLFLLSDKSSWITGSSFVVDGGSLCIP